MGENYSLRHKILSPKRKEKERTGLEAEGQGFRGRAGALEVEICGRDIVLFIWANIDRLYLILNLSRMDQQIVSVDKSDLKTFHGYIGNFWLFLQLEQPDLAAQLDSEKNAANIVAFASNYEIRFIILQRSKDGKVAVELEWGQEMLSTCNILLIKKNNFNIYKDITPFKIAEMVQVVNLDFQNESDPLNVSYQYINKLMMPMLGLYRNDFEKKSTSDKNTFTNIMRKVNELNFSFAQCQEMVTVPEVKIQIPPKVKEIVAQKQTEKYLNDPELITQEEAASFGEDVLKWNRDIDSLLKSQFDLMSSTSLQEKIYWNSFVTSLRDLETQVQSEEVKFCIAILKKKSKFHLIMSFDTVYASAKKKVENANQISQFFQSLPISEMMTSQTIEELNTQLTIVLQNLKKIVNIDYDIKRVYQLIEVISKDLYNQMLKILGQENLMFCNFDEFKMWYDKANEIFKKFDENVSYFMSKTKGIGYSGIISSAQAHNKTIYHYVPLKNRLDQLFRIRDLHERLKTVIEDIIARSGSKVFLSINDIEAGYNSFKGINVLDISKEGEETLARCEKEFNHNIDSAETYITKRLREKLGGANNASEMFRIFSKFSGLFFRQRIKSAIEEYQSQLLKTVKDGINFLDKKFLTGYDRTENSRICKVRDIPENPGKIIWAKQIRIKLEKYEKRIEGILLENWKDHPEGKEIKQKIDALLKQLNTEQLKREWEKDTGTLIRSIELNKKSLFKLVKKNKHEVAVNFEPRHIEIIKEIKTFESIQSRSNSVIYAGKNLIEYYPFVVSLQESIYSYHQVTAKIDEKILKLLAEKKKSVMSAIDDGFKSNWSESSKMVEKYSKNLAEVVLELNEMQALVSEKCEVINTLIQSLTNCPIKSEVLSEKLTAIQDIINDFNRREVSNLHVWVPELNQQLQKIFAKRVETLINEWIAEFRNFKDLEEQEQAKHLEEGMRHEIKSENNVFFLDPPLEHAKFSWLQEFHRVLGIICSLPRLEANQYSGSLGTRDKTDENYEIVLQKIDSKTIQKAYDEIFTVFGEAENYIKLWFNYEALWVIDPKKIYDKLGDDISLWQNLLNEIRENRKTFDNSQTEKYFGPIIIDYRLVLNKINTKYDSWHNEIIGHFGTKFGDTLKSFYSNCQNARSKLEKVNFQNLSADIVDMINDFQYIKKKHFEWSKEVEKFDSSNKLLERQRYKYPADWLEIDKVMQEWASFKQIFKRKSEQLDSEIPRLQDKIVNDERQLNEKISEIETQWNREKPSANSDLSPKDALNVLEVLNSRINSVKDNYDKCCKAKELLNLSPGDPQKLHNLGEDIGHLQEVWAHLQTVWAPYESIRDTFITAISKNKIKDISTEVINLLNKTPAKLKTNEPFEAMKQKVNIPGGTYYLMGKKIMELKEECMKPRHWKMLQSKLRIDGPQNEITFGKLWKADLNRNEPIFKEVMAIATGEMVLERMLQLVKERWLPRELELVRYQGKCNLIKGWDDMFELLDEDLNNLSSMKLSQYYRTFEEEIVQWDDKLQKMRIILDIWIDVQRRWVYLESIFLGSSDIKEMLVNEYSRFKSIDSEFTSLMKKVSSKPNLLETMNIPALQKTLERLSEMLANIQKALGDYLETQRAAFARFYFIGDEDLLEIIGNSKDVAVVQRHFTKMYAGITSLRNEKTEGQDIIHTMLSREGEVVEFKKGVNITEDPKINVWLTKVDKEMQMTLATFLEVIMGEISEIEERDGTNVAEELIKIIEANPAQVVLLGLQTLWSKKVENALIEGGGEHLQKVEKYVVNFLTLLASNVVADLKKDLRQKFEQAITDFVHQRDVVRKLIKNKVESNKVFAWLYFMRMIYFPKEQDTLKKLSIQMANANFHYGFEYLGVGEKLVQTPLTDRCYLTLTQALHLRMGGAPFGPAGTGKTESVKALGAQLGRFVLVFNCDETFDFHAMGRIFIGLCQVGAWGCFDEFNRLEERMLSACSQQILVIQTGLRERQNKIELMGKQVKLNSQVGSFVTMNPGYAGRSNLPENLKQLFRQMAMVKPDGELIAQVMLYSQGFKTAEQLAGKIVSLFDLCKDQLSSQPHYDFGLRALKSVLVSAGNMKREEIMKMKKEGLDANTLQGQELNDFEQRILLRSVCETIVPKLIANDIPLLSNLLQGVFPGSVIPVIAEPELRENLKKICKQILIESEECFIEKVLQLFQIQRLHHGLMMVGPSGCGKSKAWQVLMHAMEKTDKIKGESYVIDPKSITKDELYGKLDNTTLEWTDGVFTGVLRKITENQRGEAAKRHWIIFDGDVDPEWAENLNSVLDDNKLLTLPNGERIQIPPNVKIMFEVETLKYATLATVSRCGMVWFSEEVIHPKMIFSHYLQRLRQDDYDKPPKISLENESKQESEKAFDPIASTRERCVAVIEKFFLEENSFGERALEIVEKMEHVMEFTVIRVVEAAMALIRKGISNVLEYNESHPELPLEDEILTKYMRKWMIQSIMWGFGGSMTLREREKLSKKLADIIPTHEIDLPSVLHQVEGSAGVPYILIDFEIKIEDGEWHLWKKRVPTVEIDPQKVTDADVIIPTVDTIRHQQVLCSWLSEHRPFLLCGPPGSGKTMTLMSTLKALPDFEMIFVNFSSSTNPGLIMKQFEHYCEYVKTVSGIILRPKQPSKWLVVFCDEINLPDSDKYGTMTVITFLRQLTEQHGFWRTSDKQWISLERIQFVGACNPPTDIGRKPLNPRFLRHCPLILVDFPGFDSLKQIFGTFNKAMLKRSLSLRTMADCLTNAMVQFYTESQKHFTADIQPHYIYSPRELTRWKYAINEAIETIDTVEDLVRLWAHEALRLFEDRLVLPEEKQWCENLIDEVANRNFPSLSSKCLERPILFSNYLTKNYVSVDQAELKTYVEARLKIFYEEQLNVPIVVFDEVLEHILRIDRVLRQPLGHLLLVGASGVGKTTLSRFVSWLNNISVFQIKAGRNYSLNDFDEDLRAVMKRAGVKQERICFIFDESNCLSPAFLEKMNALLASGEIPGLFEGEEYMLLIGQYKESNSKGLTSDDQIYRSFIKNVQRNLHVVFTMNPSNPDFSNRTASSPALFNRCVIDWFGDWSEEGLLQVAKEFTNVIDPVVESFESPVQEDEQRHQIVINTIVGIHSTVIELNRKLAKSAKKFNFITPRDFLDFIKHFVELYNEKKSMLEDQQFHLNVGLDKLKQTETQVMEMQGSLDEKKRVLEIKEKEASSKMTMIVQEKTKAKEKQTESAALKIKLEAKQVQISEKKVVVERDLEKALPELEAAQKNVENINKRDLDVVKGYAKPPEKVEFALKPIYCMLTKSMPAKGKPLEWATIKAFMQKDFIKQVVELKADDIPEKVKNYVLTEYLNTPQFDIPTIANASAAVGALASWAKSQLSYADILTRVAPMRQEISELQEEGSKLQNQAKELADTIDELEKRTKQLEVEYENLIKEKQEIVNDMTKVEEKVSRSKNLLMNLSSEKYRWEDTSKNFKSQLASMLGDVFLSSAFLAYIGFFDHYYRKLLSGVWKTNLEASKIKYRPELAIIEFLSNPSERLIWRSHKLPSDDLCTENAIIMKRYHKYPLIIDPSGQAIEYLTSLMSDKQFILSSFADDAFLKNLEKSIRFGRPLIVQDVEKIEPILNSVLNKEIYKTGGMTLIRVGDQEIDFNANFSMFMITRNSNARFTPDLCSRVTFVNFTITPSSLEDQCLNIFLRNERPDVEEKRLSLMKIQGEYVVKLRELEDALLDSLSNVQGSILESESVITTLEKLKTQATKITEEMKKSDEIMNEVNNVTNGYKPIAEASSKIFFALESMSGLHYLYEYSLNFFMDTVLKLLESDEKLNKISKKEYEQRKDAIMNLLFEKIFSRVANSLLSKDLIIFSLKLVQIKLPEKLKPLFELLIKSTTKINTTLSKTLIQGTLSEDQLKHIEELSEHEIFSGLLEHIENNESKWVAFMEANNPEQLIPDVKVETNAIGKKIFDLILIKTFRPDKFNSVAYDLIKAVLGEECHEGMTLDFKNVITSCKSKEPILLSSAPGYDPSFKVEQTSKDLHTKLFSVAIGSSEGFELADRSIKEAVKQGAWVMLKNVHLDPAWLSELEKKIHVLKPHQNFRLFLTAEFSPKIPSTLIRQSYKLVFEPADGVKASLLRTYKTVFSPARCDKQPAERSRLHFLLAWLHAVILERLRYTPIGWTKVYEFNEADQRCALDLIDEYIDSFGPRNNIDIDKIPWDAFQTILIENLYGGKIDNQYDSKILVSLVEMFFTAKSFDSTYPLYRSDDPKEKPFTMPDGIKYSQFLAWVEKLPNVESPAWSGLPNNVQKILKTDQTNRAINELIRLQDVNEEQVTLEKKKEEKQNKQVKWLSEVNDKVSTYLTIIPKEIARLERTEEKMNNPLFRFLEREVTVATKLLVTIQRNSIDTQDLCNGKILATNILRELAKDIHADTVPKSWVTFTIDPNITLTNYIVDLQRRFEQFNKLIATPNYQNSGVWFGGLLFPEAYMTATRQFVAQRNGWSLEELELRVKRYNGQKLDEQSLLMSGMRIEGGHWNQNNLIVPVGENEEIGSSLPDMLMTWEKVADKNPAEDEMMIPVYLNRTRKNLIMSLRVKCGENRTLLYQKGIAIITWTI